jgi:hypothetical protein
VKEIHVGDSVRVGSRSEEIRGTVVDLDRRPGYGRLIIDSVDLADPHAPIPPGTSRRDAAKIKAARRAA